MNKERDAARGNAYRASVLSSSRKTHARGFGDGFDAGWNAAEKHTRQKIADELEQVRLTTGDMFNEFGAYIKQLREK